MKKLLLILMACLVVVSFSAPSSVEAAKKSYKAPSKSYSPTKPSKDSGVTKTNPTNTAGTGAATTNRGFFSGGSLMKGLMIGGLAGMLFGGMFGGMGFFGDMLGMLVNVLAIIALIMVIRAVFAYFKRRNEPPKKRFQE
ncbi:preprotein translocase subunit Tim44 [Paenibacillus koleovorans]|uniref:preprotein translocase subunit Tim44 n=1 Tax=Paenibacillus koleovorans TaxID=121608 RepID=UPI000FD874C4|nr:preprotein translocase subunit Tim44 [Paenibacillus koleovorans]